MNLVDLHVHSTASDGTVPPEELPALAHTLGLRAMALTDHDTVAGIAAAQAAGKKAQVEVLGGIEISTDYQGREVHLLGYGVDPAAPSLKPVLEWTVEDRNRRNEKIVDSLQRDGYAISLEQLYRAHPGAVIGRPHMAQALWEAGQVGSIQEAFDALLGEGCPYFLPRSYMPFAQAAETILQAGGVPVLAHPYQYGFDAGELEQLVATAAERGARGMEVWYSGYTREQSGALLALCQAYTLLPTGGSDYHGARKPHIQLGEGTGGLNVPWEAYCRLKELLEEVHR